VNDNSRATIDRQIDALVDDWSASGKCHPMAQLYGTTEEKIRLMEAS
jgi:hypothetical protein